MPTPQATSKKTRLASHLGLGAMAWFALLVVVTNGSTSAFAQAGAEGEPLSPGDFIGRYREVLVRQKVRYHDARVDGKNSARSERPTKASQSKKPKQASPNPSPVSVSFSLARSGVNEKLHVIRTGRNPLDSVVVSAGSHAFQVRRGTLGDPYMLDWAKDESSRLSDRLRQKVLDSPYSPAGLDDFPAYVTDPEFQVKQVERTAGSDAPAIKFSFRYLPNQRYLPNLPNQPKKPNLEGWVRLEGASDWVIRDYEIEATWWPLDPERKLLEKHSGSIRYAQKDGVSVPSEIMYTERRSSGFAQESVSQIDNFILGPTPAEEFTLAAFGLGDFELPTARATNQRSYYLALFGITALVMSFVLAAIARFRWKWRADASVPGGPV
jgi:hypothetical protein